MNAADPDRDVEAADRRFRAWMKLNLDRAADHFGLVIAAKPTFGWLLRSVGAPADSAEGRVWLRVVSERPEWAGGSAWTGNADANALRGLPKPRLLDAYEWAEGDWRCQRAEILTLLPGASCSTTADARSDIALPLPWWETLRDVVARLAATPTDRISIDQDKIDHRVGEAFGNSAHVSIECWETVHADLHWGNLLADPFGMVDWELWGKGPVGTDAATLHCYSLAVPSLARTVRDHFPVLDTPDGHRAQLYVIARLLHRARFGDHPQLIEPLRLHAQALWASLNLWPGQ